MPPGNIASELRQFRGISSIGIDPFPIEVIDDIINDMSTPWSLNASQIQLYCTLWTSNDSPIPLIQSDNALAITSPSFSLYALQERLRDITELPSDKNIFDGTIYLRLHIAGCTLDPYHITYIHNSLKRIDPDLDIPFNTDSLPEKQHMCSFCCPHLALSASSINLSTKQHQPCFLDPVLFQVSFNARYLSPIHPGMTPLLCHLPLHQRFTFHGATSSGPLSILTHNQLKAISDHLEMHKIRRIDHRSSKWLSSLGSTPYRSGPSITPNDETTKRANKSGPPIFSSHETTKTLPRVHKSGPSILSSHDNGPVSSSTPSLPKRSSTTIETSTPRHSSVSRHATTALLSPPSPLSPVPLAYGTTSIDELSPSSRIRSSSTTGTADTEILDTFEDSDGNQSGERENESNKDHDIHENQIGIPHSLSLDPYLGGAAASAQPITPIAANTNTQHLALLTVTSSYDEGSKLNNDQHNRNTTYNLSHSTARSPDASSASSASSSAAPSSSQQQQTLIRNQAGSFASPSRSLLRTTDFINMHSTNGYAEPSSMTAGGLSLVRPPMGSLISPSAQPQTLPSQLHPQLTSELQPNRPQPSASSAALLAPKSVPNSQPKTGSASSSSPSSLLVATTSTDDPFQAPVSGDNKSTSSNQQQQQQQQQQLLPSRTTSTMTSLTSATSNDSHQQAVLKTPNINNSSATSPLPYSMSTYDLDDLTNGTSSHDSNIISRTQTLTLSSRQQQQQQSSASKSLSTTATSIESDDDDTEEDYSRLSDDKIDAILANLMSDAPFSTRKKRRTNLTNSTNIPSSINNTITASSTWSLLDTPQSGPIETPPSTTTTPSEYDLMEEAVVEPSATLQLASFLQSPSSETDMATPRTSSQLDLPELNLLTSDNKVVSDNDNDITTTLDDLSPAGNTRTLSTALDQPTPLVLITTCYDEDDDDGNDNSRLSINAATTRSRSSAASSNMSMLTRSVTTMQHSDGAVLSSEIPQSYLAPTVASSSSSSTQTPLKSGDDSNASSNNRMLSPNSNNSSSSNNNSGPNSGPRGTPTSVTNMTRPGLFRHQNTRLRVIQYGDEGLDKTAPSSGSETPHFTSNPHRPGQAIPSKISSRFHDIPTNNLQLDQNGQAQLSQVSSVSTFDAPPFPATLSSPHHSLQQFSLQHLYTCGTPLYATMSEPWVSIHSRDFSGQNPFTHSAPRHRQEALRSVKIKAVMDISASINIYKTIIEHKLSINIFRDKIRLVSHSINTVLEHITKRLSSIQQRTIRPIVKRLSRRSLLASSSSSSSELSSSSSSQSSMQNRKTLTTYPLFDTDIIAKDPNISSFQISNEGYIIKRQHDGVTRLHQRISFLRKQVALRRQKIQKQITLFKQLQGIYISNIKLLISRYYEFTTSRYHIRSPLISLQHSIILHNRHRILSLTRNITQIYPLRGTPIEACRHQLLLLLFPTLYNNNKISTSSRLSRALTGQITKLQSQQTYIQSLFNTLIDNSASSNNNTNINSNNNNDRIYSINNIPLILSKQFILDVSAISPIFCHITSLGLSYVAIYVSFISRILDITLRYPIHLSGSKSGIYTNYPNPHSILPLYYSSSNKVQRDTGPYGNNNNEQISGPITYPYMTTTDVPIIGDIKVLAMIEGIHYLNANIIYIIQHIMTKKPHLVLSKSQQQHQQQHYIQRQHTKVYTTTTSTDDQTQHNNEQITLSSFFQPRTPLLSINELLKASNTETANNQLAKISQNTIKNAASPTTTTNNNNTSHLQSYDPSSRTMLLSKQQQQQQQSLLGSVSSLSKTEHQSNRPSSSGRSSFSYLPSSSSSPIMDDEYYTRLFAGLPTTPYTCPCYDTLLGGESASYPLATLASTVTTSHCTIHTVLPSYEYIQHSQYDSTQLLSNLIYLIELLQL